MKNGEVRVPSTWRVTIYPQPDLGIPGSVNDIDDTARYEIVSSSAIIKGNLVDPNPWKYTVRRQAEWYAHRDLYEVLGGSLRYTQRAVGCARGSSDPLYRPSFDSNPSFTAALEKLNERVRGDLDLAVDLAELGSTARMLKNTALLLSPHNLVKAAGGLLTPKRRLRTRPPGHKYTSITGLGSTKDIANGYLEWKYGWAPLMQSVFDAADEAIRFVLNRFQRYKARATIPDGILPSQRGLVAGIPCDVHLSGNARTSTTIGIKLDLTREFDLARWTSLNPFSLAWELIPYSFVADWVFDVGSHLRNLETALLYDKAFVNGYISTLQSYDLQHRVYQTTWQPGGGTTTYVLRSANAASLGRVFERQSLSSYPLPQAVRLNVDLSSSQMMTAAALLRQRLRF